MRLFFTRIGLALVGVVKEAAREAVLEAEKLFGSGQGQLKKQAAVNLVVSALPVPPFLKPIAAKLLASIIDAAIEAAVAALTPNPTP